MFVSVSVGIQPSVHDHHDKPSTADSTFGIDGIRPKVIVVDVLLAVGVSVVALEVDLSFACINKLLAEAALHGHAILWPQLAPEALVEVSRVSIARPACHLAAGDTYDM